MISKTLVVNGMSKTLLVNPENSLADVLRGQLLLTSVKVGCGTGQCGACNVIVDGKLVRTCNLRMKRVQDNASIMTLEGIGTPEHLHPLQLSWMYHGGAQCGFCTPGFIVSAKCLLDNNPAPTRAEIRDWFQSHRFYTQRQPRMPIEPDVGYGYMNEEGKLVIHSKSIGLHLHGLMIAPGLGLDFGNDMIMVQCNAGGTFGYKFSPTMEALIGVAVLATGRPCHLRYNYEQQQQYTGKRSPFFTTVRYAADKTTGRIKAMESDWIVDHGPYSEFGDLLTLRGARVTRLPARPENVLAALKK